MIPSNRLRVMALLGLVVVLAGAYSRPSSEAVADVTTPLEAFGASIGDDYFLATYSQLESYWRTLAEESDRVSLVDIGRTEEGRTQWMAVVSSPDNLRQIDRYREISRRLALAEGLTDAEARGLAARGKAVVWIDGGLHATEVLGAQQLVETVYQLAAGSDDETERILQDVVVLAAHANPDGHELVASWYMREADPARRTLAGLPRAYQKYVGHDINRDFYMSTQAESTNINRVLYREWFPQVVYDHHQTAPRGTVMFAPPLSGPTNSLLDPLVPASIELFGGAMHARFAAEGKPGVTMRSGSNYSTWWNGGLRTTAYFHNQIGLLTETFGSPTPSEIPDVPARRVASDDLPMPITPQPWRFRQAVEYSVAANRAVLDVASRYREELLLGVYQMGRRSIDRGNREAPWGYVLPADQGDFPTAVKFVDALLKAGVAVHRATAPFVLGGQTYPVGSYLVKTAQAFRPHVLDMFEPQRYPGAPDGAPARPYDSAGWTLALQMGVRFDRIARAFDGPFARVDSAEPPAAVIGGVSAPAGFLLRHHQNDAYVATNRLLAAGEEVHWLRDRSLGDGPAGTGAIYVPASAVSRSVLERAASELGLSVTGVGRVPGGAGLRLVPTRVALWDRHGGASSSGWTRWLLERFEFPFEVVHTRDIDSGGLVGRYDVLILPSEAVLDAGSGSPSSERTLPRLEGFVGAGGTIVAVGRAAAIGQALGLPVTSALVDPSNGRPLSARDHSVPASILRVRVDNREPLGYGLEPDVDVFFDNGPVFRLLGSSGAIRPVAWFADPAPLRSGWALGQEYLLDGVAVADARLGRGRVLLFGPEITFRAQPHGTFKFLFNAIYSGSARPAGLDEDRSGSRASVVQ